MLTNLYTSEFYFFSLLLVYQSTLFVIKNAAQNDIVENFKLSAEKWGDLVYYRLDLNMYQSVFLMQEYALMYG